MPENASSPLCSICCLSYNHAPYIESHFRSIYRQSYTNVEIIALDDGSSDGSAEMLKKIQANSPYPMKLILQPNSGNIAGNFNALWRQASGKYIVFISCDDMLTEASIQKKIAMLEEDAGKVFVASRSQIFVDENDSRLYENSLETLSRDKIIDVGDLLDTEFNEFATFYIQASVLRKEFVDAVGGFDEDLAGDDIVLRIKLFLYMQRTPGLTFSIVDDYGFYYRLHGSNVHKNTAHVITVIQQVLDRFFPHRPHVDAIRKLALLGFENLEVAEVFRLLDLQHKWNALLKDRQIIEAIRLCTMRCLGKQPLTKYFFRREKNGNYRTITLLSFIKIKYRKYKQKSVLAE